MKEFLKEFLNLHLDGFLDYFGNPSRIFWMNVRKNLWKISWRNQRFSEKYLEKKSEVIPGEVSEKISTRLLDEFYEGMFKEKPGGFLRVVFEELLDRVPAVISR